MGRQSGRRQQRVDAYDFLKQCRDGTVGMPEYGRQIRKRFTFFGKFKEDGLALVGVDELEDEKVEFVDGSGGGPAALASGAPGAPIWGLGLSWALILRGWGGRGAGLRLMLMPLKLLTFV